MKQSTLRILSLVLILTLLATSGAMAFEFKDTSNMSYSETSDYARELFAETDKIPFSITEFQNMKPVLDELIFIEKTPALASSSIPGLAWYAVKLQPLSGFEEFFEKANYPGYDSVEVYTSQTKDGEYQLLGYANFSNHQTMNAFCYGAAVFSYNLEPYKYAKIRYLRYDAGVKTYTEYSDPVKIPVRPIMMPSSPAMYKITSSEAFVTFRNESGLTRVLQIREKGAEKWASVSKSKLVNSYKSKSGGYTLKLDTSKEYELRARYYKQIDGKKYYSDYVYFGGYKNPKTSPNLAVKFLRYDYGKDDYALYITKQKDYTYTFVDMGRGAPLKSYQIASRKSGTSKWTYTYVNSRSSSNHGFLPAKYGYEYKVRPYTTVSGNKAKASTWSKVYKCTNKSAAYVNEATREDNSAGHVIYDHSKTYEQNYQILQERVWDLTFERFWDDGLSPNYEDRGTTGKIDHSRVDEGFIGVNAFGGGDREALLEMFSMYAEDSEVAHALLAWVMSYSSTFGHANSDFFGFKDVKKTKNGFIMEMNGQQIEVEKAELGNTFWFDMTD